MYALILQRNVNPGSNWGKGAGGGVHDVAADTDIARHQGMVDDEVYRFSNCVGGVGKAVEPSVEVNAAVTHQRDVFFIHAALTHQVEHFFGIHALNAASGMTYDHNFVDSKLIDRYQERAHGGVERVRDGTAGILNHLDVAIFYSEGGGKKLDKAGVHASYYGYALVGILGRFESTICSGSNKFTIMLKDFVNHWILKTTF